MPKNARAAAPFMEAMLTRPAPVLEVFAEVLVDVPVWVPPPAVPEL
jgi:hypothetical protein